MLQEVGGASATEVGTYRFVSSPEWSSDGRLVFRADGRTYVLPRFGETPREIAAAAMPRWSPDGSRIVSIEQPRGPRGRPGRVLFTSLATAETTSVALPDTLSSNDGVITDVAWSPNGETLAFEVRENPRQGGGPFTIWTMATDGSQPTSLIGAESRFCLGWPAEGKGLYVLGGNDQEQEVRTIAVGARSPSAPELLLGGLRDVDRNTDPCMSLTADGTTLLFTQVQQIANLWRLSTGDGARPAQLTTGTQLVADPAVSPDGQLVAYTAYNPTQGGNVFTVPTTGGAPKQVTVGSGGYAAWSPDGREIAFISSRGGARRVYVVSSDGGVERAVGQPAEGMIAWAPGSRILYHPADDSLFHSLDPMTGDDRPVPGTEGLSRPVPSPDGSHVAMLLRRRQNAVVIVSLETGERTTAYDADRRAPVAPIRWSDDGAALFIYEVQDTTSRILRVSPRGGTAKPVFTLPYSLSAGFSQFLGLGPDARDVVYQVLDSRSDVWLIENVGSGR
jgi:Tol biopolymer transport system component